MSESVRPVAPLGRATKSLFALMLAVMFVMPLVGRAPAANAAMTVPTFTRADYLALGNNHVVGDFNGASYRIQIDDSSTFSTPTVVDRTVTASQFTSPTLAANQYWWRVRGINSAGTAGAWSTVRRFTPQAAPSAPTLSAIALSPTSVVGGNTSQGTATITSAAPAGGFAVTLSSSDTGAATAPASVTIPAGSTKATFAIPTSAVTASTPVTITLSATNGRDAVWSGACSSGVNRTRTCTFTINGNASLTATVQ